MSRLLKALGVGLVLIVGLAVIGFLVIRQGPIPYAVLEARYATPASRYLDLPGGLHVHYRDEGRRDGPTIVLIHGFSDSTVTWNGWIRALGADYRLISLDLPGHGLTRAPATYVADSAAFDGVVDQTTRKLGVDRFALAGNSMGGGVAWRYALAHPDRLTALILVDAAGWPETDAGRDPPLAFKLLRTDFGRWLLRQIDLRPLIRDGLKKAFYDPSKADPAMVDRFADFSHAPDHPAIISHMQDGPRTFADARQLATIRTPTLVMHGDHDRLIPVENGRRFANAIPGAQLIVYPNVGHLPQMEISDRSAADLKAFLRAHGG